MARSIQMRMVAGCLTPRTGGLGSWRVIVAAVLACVIAILSDACVARAAGWSSVAGLPPGNLGSVSCVGGDDCVAVGFARLPDSSAYGQQEAVEAARWDGAQWRVQPLQAPPDPDRSMLTGASCASAHFCMAVGIGYPEAIPLPFYDRTLAELWDGSSWTVQPTPDPSDAGGENELAGVACASVTNCMAVGAYAQYLPFPALPIADIPFTERWDGLTWTLEPTPAGGARARLTAVSCGAPTACMAVGVTAVGSGDAVLAERWDGSSWVIEPTPILPGNESVLQGVSCTSAAACVAVGFYRSASTPSADIPLIERWDGTSWSVHPTQAPDTLTRDLGSYGGELNAVSCYSKNNCVAVGNTSPPVGFSEIWNGHMWLLQLLPSRSSDGDPASGALGVSCGSPTTCLAIGQHAATFSTQVPGPSNQFSIQRVRANATGIAALSLRVPQPGTVDVLETAWEDDAKPNNKVVRPAVLRPAPRRFVFARAQTTGDGLIRLVVRPNARGRRLISHHRFRVTLRLWVTYSPVGGQPRSAGIYGLHLGANCSPSPDVAPVRPRPPSTHYVCGHTPT
jgi:hypothetical protein